MTRTVPFLVALLAALPAAAQSPEMRGPVAFAVWDAGAVPADTVTLPTRVYYPTSGGPYPLVGVIHGADANRDYHVELASTLASWGFVAVVPSMPCSVIVGCNHAANQRQISALLEWAVAQSADGSSMIAGRVDGSRRGLIGHSWGGLSSHLTAAADPSIDSVVLLDPNDDAGAGLAATSTITAPMLQLIAQNEGGCNSAWREAMVRDRLTGPNLQVQIDGSGHCNPGEMDVVCSIACGSGAASTTPIFRRYAVAWTACVLGGDPSFADWIGGTGYAADVSSGLLENVFEVGLDTLPCRSGGLPDAGPGEDAGVVPGLDAGGSELDAGGTSGTDAGSIARIDAGGGEPPVEGSSCGCRVPGGGARPSLVLLGLAFVVVALVRRR